MHTNITIEKKPGSLVVITGELPYADLEAQRGRQSLRFLKRWKLMDSAKVMFLEILLSKIGEMPLITEMAERALLERRLPQLVIEHKLDVIGYPQIGITKIAKDNPLGFTITVAVAPEITLPTTLPLQGGLC